MEAGKRNGGRQLTEEREGHAGHEVGPVRARPTAVAAEEEGVGACLWARSVQGAERHKHADADLDPEHELVHACDVAGQVDIDAEDDGDGGNRQQMRRPQEVLRLQPDRLNEIVAEDDSDSGTSAAADHQEHCPRERERHGVTERFPQVPEAFVNRQRLLVAVVFIQCIGTGADVGRAQLAVAERPEQ